jgi:hypothetical protein
MLDENSCLLFLKIKVSNPKGFVVKFLPLMQNKRGLSKGNVNVITS